MSKVTYEQAMADWRVLWAIAPAHDMTGGYEDQNDLARLLKHPTKATARDCLCDQIGYWFQVGPEQEGAAELRSVSFDDLADQHPEIVEIYERHNVSWHW